MEHCNYIDSKWLSPEESYPVQIVSPANSSQTVFESFYADKELADQAVDAVTSAYHNWSCTNFTDRVILVEKFLSLIEKNKDHLAETITLENGKLLSESYAEISSSLHESYYQLNFIKENLSEKIKDHTIYYEPIGPVLLITPWNFPVATILRKLIPAILCGNSAIVKASEVVPFSTVSLFKLIDKTGFPGGVINLLNGYGHELVPQILNSKKIKAVSFTGSDVNGKKIAEIINTADTRYQAEMGGNNTVLVLKDADLESAADDIVSNGFACCGQWCTGTGKVIVEEFVSEKLNSLILKCVNKIKMGSGADPSSTMGPLINQNQLDKTIAAVALAEKEGAGILSGGKIPDEPALKNGYFFEPTIISNIKSEMKIADEEIFGPVIRIETVSDLAEAVKRLNSSKYGLSFSVYTSDNETAEEICRQVDSGVCHINLPTAYRDPALPLLGWKNSGIGLPEAGRFARDFFTRTKVIYKA